MQANDRHAAETPRCWFAFYPPVFGRHRAQLVAVDIRIRG